MGKYDVLIACERFGIVRDAFIKRGYKAISCDTEPTEASGPHYQGDVLDIMNDGFDLMIAHPPCKYLANCGSRWWGNRHSEQDQLDALAFVRKLMGARIPHICIENPPGKIGSAIREASQYVHPWQYGHGEKKPTGLWLKGLPMLKPTMIVEDRSERIHRMAPGPNRSIERAKTYQGIADAFADQWGVREVYQPTLPGIVDSYGVWV